MNELIPSIQVPPFLQGPDAQSSILVPHVGPLNPEAQLHENARFYLGFRSQKK